MLDEGLPEVPVRDARRAPCEWRPCACKIGCLGSMIRARSVVSGNVVSAVTAAGSLHRRQLHQSERDLFLCLLGHGRKPEGFDLALTELRSGLSSP